MVTRRFAGWLLLWSTTIAVAALTVSPALAETTVTFVNRQEGTVKFAVYNAGDVLQAVPLATWNVNPGKSVDWGGPPSRFHVKVFVPQLVDQLLASRNNVPYNTIVTVNPNNVISYKTKSSLRITNASTETIKVLVYKANDTVMMIALTTFTIGKGRTVTWLDAPSTFNLKVFRPQLFDQLLLTRMNVPDRKSLVVRGGGSRFTLDIRN
jgi:hypothetical protein